MNKKKNLVVLPRVVYYNREYYNEAFIEENENDIDRLRSKHFEFNRLNVSHKYSIVGRMIVVRNTWMECTKWEMH